MDGWGPRLVLGVDGTGRTHRLRALADGHPAVVWLRAVPSDRDAGVRPVAALCGTTGDELEIGRALASWGRLVVVDDAHWLHADALGALVAAARAGTPLAVAHRPPAGSVPLAALDDVLGALGPVVILGRCDPCLVGELVPEGAVPPADPDELHRRGGGFPAVITLLLGGSEGRALLQARVERRLAVAGPAAGALAEALAVAPAGEVLPLATVAAVSGVADVAGAAAALEACGLLDPSGERLVPAVAEAVRASLTGPARRRVEEAWGLELHRLGLRDAAAHALRAAGARGPAAADVFLAQAEGLRVSDPRAAAAWVEEAARAGGHPDALAPVREEVALRLGGPAPSPAGVPADDARRRRAAVARAARDLRWDRAVAAAEGDPLAGALAAPGLVALGDAPGARQALAVPGLPDAARLLGEACVAALDGPVALPLLVEAAEVLERHPPEVVLADTPHAVGALVATVAGDLVAAEHLLERALGKGAGGPGAAARHRLLLAWARLRAGRYDTAIEVVHAGPALDDPRDELLLVALQAGLARRSGDVARSRDAWARAEPVLLRGTVGLFVLEPLEELLATAARLREHRRVPALVDELGAIVARAGHPPTWAAAAGWLRLQLAIAADDDEGVVEAAATLSPLTGAAGRPGVLAGAASVWADLRRGEVHAPMVQQAATDLAAAGVPWEGSRLAGQAAIRATDAAVARRLLEQARELAADTAEPAAPAAGGLTERELEIARFVVDGLTHKEIGAQLFVAPKTVEHHVARIRTKVGATTRAEMLAALRGLLPS